MAGHSRWAKVKHFKGAIDAKRGRIFGAQAGPDRRGYYSYEVGAWHIVSLNSNLPADSRSDQVKWLKDDLKEHPTACTMAYWHIPVFSSGDHGWATLPVESDFQLQLAVHYRF
jgi:hypothetical protein